MKDYKNYAFHPHSEDIVKICCERANNSNPTFFRLILAYYYGVLASHMRVSVRGYTNSDIPINIYTINLAPSGTGKGLSTTLIDYELLSEFKRVFFNETLPVSMTENIKKLAKNFAYSRNTDYEDEVKKFRKEYRESGNLLFSFDSTNSSAIKHLRHKLLLANCGGLNLQIDEIGSNLIKETDSLTTFLELYDRGFTKDKLIKSDIVKNDYIDGSTPANILLFGTPVKLLDSSNTETEFYSMLETGYARRSLFGYTKNIDKMTKIDAKTILKAMQSTSTSKFLNNYTKYLGELANVNNLHKIITIDESVAIELIDYRLYCDEISQKVPNFNHILKTEIDHRYFKVLKLAGAYAFIDESNVITKSHLHYAIRLVEESGLALQQLLIPERPYMRLASYLAESDTLLTLADLDTDLAYFRGSIKQKEELINMSIAFGYKNNIIIKKDYLDGILFIEGENLQKSTIDNCIISASKEITENYHNDNILFKDLKKLATANNYHWVNHHLQKGYRNEDSIIKGFNLLVLDLDKDVTFETVKQVLAKYTVFIYTTKRHTEKDNRFRVILLINYILKLNKEDYTLFMNNVFDSLPFTTDRSTVDRCRKWLPNKSNITFYNEGELFDITPFIPRTKKNETRIQQFTSDEDISNLEYWFINHIGKGNRNNQLHNYARVLIDKKMNFELVREKVLLLNSKITNKLTEDEIDKTIMQTVLKKL